MPSGREQLIAGWVVVCPSRPPACDQIVRPLALPEDTYLAATTLFVNLNVPI